MNSKNFVNPPAEFRVVPFWFWNGAVDEGEILRQIREMQEKGVGGFCLAARPGLRLPYLSQVWFDRVRLAVETAASLGLQVWLHDEFPFPGGKSSERVALGNPHYRAQYLLFEETTVQGGQQVDTHLPWATVLRAIAVPLRRDRSLWDESQDIRPYIGVHHRQEVFRESGEMDEYHDKQYFTLDAVHRLYWKAPPGRWRVLVFLQKEFEAPEFPGTYFDPFNREAVDCFLETTFQPYVETIGEQFGRTVSTVLTMETVCRKDRLLWSPLLPQIFRDRNGYDLLDCLPGLITAFGPNTARIRYNYFQTLSELIRDHYHGACEDWCNAHRVQYASIVPVLRNAHQTRIHVPGTSGGREKIGALEIKGSNGQTSAYRWNPKFAASLAHQTKLKRVFNASHQGTGWSMTLQDMKWIADRLGSQGCNLFTLYGFAYTLDGLRKHDTPPSQFHQNPYWKHFRLFSDYAGRLSYILCQGRHVADIALLDPVTSLWTHLSHPDLGWDYVGSDPDEEKRATRLVGDWTYLMDSLSRMQRDYDCLDPEVLREAKVSGGRLRVGTATYEALVIPPIANLEPAAFESIRQFHNAGGKVICLGLLPVEDIQEEPSVVEAFSRMTDMEPGRMTRDYRGHELGVHVIQRGNLYFIRTGGSVETNRGARVLGDLLNRILPKRVTVETDKQYSASVLCHHREDAHEEIFFLTNSSHVAFDSRIGLRLPGKLRTIERWDLESGRRYPITYTREGGQVNVDLPFQRFESHLIVASEGDPPKKVAEEVPEQLPLTLGGSWKIDPEEDNCLRMDRFRMQVDLKNNGIEQGWDKPGYSDRRWSFVEPKPFVEQLRGLPSLPSLPFDFPTDDLALRSHIKVPLVCWFRTTFTCETVPAKLALVMDRSAILGNYQVYLNGFRQASNAFRPTFRYDHANVTCAVGRRVFKGKNVLAVRVEIDDLAQGLVDPLFLFGRFAVKRGRNAYLRLTSPVDQGPVNRLDELGMPFYAGTVAYASDVALTNLPKTTAFIVSLEKELKGLSDIFELQINGHSLGVRPWAPYCWTGKTGWLKRGKNRVILRATNTLARLLTGKEFQPRSHRMMPVKI